MAGIEQDIFSESDEPSKQNRLSELFGWGKWKLSSTKISSPGGNRFVKNESPNAVQISPVWKCQLCNDISSDKRSAEKHVRDKHNTNPATMTAVPSNMKTENLRGIFGSEQQENHASQKNFECPICNERFEDRFRFLMHLIQANKQVVCKVCRMSCENSREIEYHKAQHKSKVPGPKCIRCHGNFSDHIFFSAHQQYCDKNLPQENRTLSGMLTCKLCKRTDIQIHGISEHLLRHRGTCRICLRNFELTHELEVHSVMNHKIQLFHCPQCPDIFTTTTNLNEHLISHTNGTISSIFQRTWPKNIRTGQGLQGSKNLTCTECSLVFFTSDHYFKHLDECHFEQFAPVLPPNENEVQADPNMSMNNATPSSACVDSKKDIKLKLYNCSFCTNFYPLQSCLQSHITEMHSESGMQEDANGQTNWLTPPESPENPESLESLQIPPQLDPEEPPPPHHPHNEAYCEQCLRDFSTKVGYHIHSGKMHNPNKICLKRERPKTPARNKRVQRAVQSRYNTNHANEPEAKYRPDGKRPNLHGVPSNNSAHPEQNWPYESGSQEYQPNGESQRTCRICGKVMPTARGLSHHVAWHKRSNWLGHNRQGPDRNTRQLPATVVKQEQSMPEQPRMHTRSDTLFNDDVENTPLSFRLLWEANAPGMNQRIKEEIRMPTVAIANNVNPNPPDEEYVNDDATRQSIDHHRFRNRYVSNDAVWKCNKCKVQVTSEALYHEHKRTHVYPERQRAASEDSSHDGNETVLHRLNGMEIFECYQCQDKFFSKKALTIHKSMHQTNLKEMNPDGGKYNCLYCKMRLKGEKAIMTHLNTHGIKAKRLTLARKLPN